MTTVKIIVILYNVLLKKICQLPLILSLLCTQGTFYVTVHATTEDQKDQRYMLPASPYEKVPSLLDKAVKRFNRTLGRDQAEVEKYILKVCVCA